MLLCIILVSNLRSVISNCRSACTDWQLYIQISAETPERFSCVNITCWIKIQLAIFFINRGKKYRLTIVMYSYYDSFYDLTHFLVLVSSLMLTQTRTKKLLEKMCRFGSEYIYFLYVHVKYLIALFVFVPRNIPHAFIQLTGKHLLSLFSWLAVHRPTVSEYDFIIFIF